MSKPDKVVKLEPDMGCVKRELVVSDVGSSAAPTKKVKRETMLQQLHRQEEQLVAWENSDGGNMLTAPLPVQSKQASELMLHIQNNQPRNWEDTEEGYANTVTKVSTKLKPTLLWALSTLPSPHDLHGYTRVDYRRGVFMAAAGRTNQERLGNSLNPFEAALITDEAKGVQIVGELNAGKLKFGEDEFWRSRQLNFNPESVHPLANVSDGHVLTTGEAASRGLLLRHYQATLSSCCAPLAPVRQHSRDKSTPTFKQHHLSEFSTIHVSTPPTIPCLATTITAVQTGSSGVAHWEFDGAREAKEARMQAREAAREAAEARRQARCTSIVNGAVICCGRPNCQGTQKYTGASWTHQFGKRKQICCTTCGKKLEASKWVVVAPKLQNL
jgi:hypothetical protein